MEIGRKSEGLLNPGYVYAPYVPITTSPAIVDGVIWRPSNRKRKIENIFNLPKSEDMINAFPRKSISSRYSTKIVNNNFYGVIEVKNPSK